MYKSVCTAITALCFLTILGCGDEPLSQVAPTAQTPAKDGDNDQDGISNGDEIELGTDPNDRDTDDDGIDDGEEGAGGNGGPGGDIDQDGIINALDDEDGSAPDSLSTTCREKLRIGETFEIDPEGRNTQIHPAAVFDGEQLWLAYNIPDAEGTFDVHLARFGCDGQPIEAPRKINTTDFNELDPTIVAANDRIYIAWQNDNGEAESNLQTYLRVLDARDGTALNDTDQHVQTSYGGAPNNGNQWMPQLTTLDGSQVLLMGSRGIPDASGFQAYLQTLDAEGTTMGETVDGFVLDGVSQIEPTVVLDHNGQLQTAWVRWDFESDEKYIVQTTFETAGELSALDDPISLEANTMTGGPNLASWHGEKGQTYLAWHAEKSGEVDVFVGDALTAANNGRALRLGAQGRIDHVPQLAVRPGGGAVAWFRQLSGIRQEIFVHSFAYDGESFEAGEEFQVPTEQPAALYAPAFVHLGEGIYFLSWAEGISPDFRLKGRLISLQ